MIDIWKLRNDLLIPIKEREDIFDEFFEKKELDLKELQELIGKVKLAQLVSLNEIALDGTDKLLIEFHEILTALPELAETHINKKVLRGYGKIFKYPEEQKYLDKYLSKVKPVNENMLNTVTKFNLEPTA